MARERSRLLSRNRRTRIFERNSSMLDAANAADWSIGRPNDLADGWKWNRRNPTAVLLDPSGPIPSCTRVLEVEKGEVASLRLIDTRLVADCSSTFSSKLRVHIPPNYASWPRHWPIPALAARRKHQVPDARSTMAVVWRSPSRIGVGFAVANR